VSGLIFRRLRLLGLLPGMVLLQGMAICKNIKFAMSSHWIIHSFDNHSFRVLFRFHQAYTQIIEDTVKDSFNMLGIRFIANNYAMGECVY